jgi:hypothetical protein
VHSQYNNNSHHVYIDGFLRRYYRLYQINVCGRVLCQYHRLIIIAALLFETRVIFEIVRASLLYCNNHPFHIRYSVLYSCLKRGYLHSFIHFELWSTISIHSDKSTLLFVCAINDTTTTTTYSNSINSRTLLSLNYSTRVSRESRESRVE